MSPGWGSSWPSCPLAALTPRASGLDATLSLVGSRKVLAAIGSGDDPRDVTAMWRTELAAFERRPAQIPALSDGE